MKLYSEGDVIAYGEGPSYTKGIVASKKDIDNMIRQSGRYPIDIVWAYWGGHLEITYMKLDRVRLIKKAHPKRKLPDWF